MLKSINKTTNNYKIIVKNVIICLISVFLLSISAQISIPLPGGVPMTLQTFSLAIIGYVFSKKCGISTILTYIILGILGIPVFAGGNFGISAVFGITGGFIIGFIPLIWCCNKARFSKTAISKIVLSGIGLMLCHLIGVFQYSILTGVTLIQAFLLVSFPFLLKDSISIALACIILNKINIL